MAKFTVGQQVYCVKSVSDFLTEGKVYVVKGFGRNSVSVKDDDGDVTSYNPDLFTAKEVAPATTNTALRELAGLIKSLSYSDMLMLAAELTPVDELAAIGAITETAQRLLNAAHNLTVA